VAGHQDQHDGRGELGQPDQPEIERVFGQRVDLPADRDRLHLQRDRGGDPRQPIERERPVVPKGMRGLVHGKTPIEPNDNGMDRPCGVMQEAWWSRGDLNP
jgi:hypothetical protein